MGSDKYIIYGAGQQGTAYFEFIKSKGLDSYIYGFCDRNSEKIIEKCEKPVFSYLKAKELNMPFIISIANDTDQEKIREMIYLDQGKCFCMDDLAEKTNMDRVSFNREFCAWFHIANMDTYFEAAEGENGLGIFWSDTSVFKKYFQKLDLTNIIELACGRGRHVPQYMNKAGKVTLVDILDKNIEFCQERFKDQSNIFYYCNNGYNLEMLESSKFSALFSYDSMVHFEMMDIYDYLKDIYRILQPGGRVLIHHSNNDENYKASFGSATYGRSFMNKDIFAYLAHRTGFLIIEQKVIDWGVKNLDCITLMEKICEK